MDPVLAILCHPHHFTQDRRQLFQLLAENFPRDIPRDVTSPEVALLRSLPIYARMTRPAAGEGGGGAGEGGGLVALGDRRDWLLVPQRCLDDLGGESGSASANKPAGIQTFGHKRAETQQAGGAGRYTCKVCSGRPTFIPPSTHFNLWPKPFEACHHCVAHELTPHAYSPPYADVVALLPADAYSRLLQHETHGGELYDRVGLDPSSPAQLLAQLLLPKLSTLPEAAATQLLGFMARDWSRMKVGGWSKLRHEVIVIPGHQDYESLRASCFWAFDQTAALTAAPERAVRCL